MCIIIICTVYGLSQCKQSETQILATLLYLVSLIQNASIKWGV